MLDLGLEAGLGHLGIVARTVAYVEREAYAASQLVALMEAGLLPPAPVWSDLATFDGRPWRGGAAWSNPTSCAWPETTGYWTTVNICPISTGSASVAPASDVTTSF